MAKRSPILGYNHNFRHRGLVFHVQTEDSGVRNPHIFTHLFHGGVIVSSRKLTYDSGADAEVIKALMQAQHRAMLKDLKRGTFDEKITDYFADQPELRPPVVTDHLETDPAAALEDDPTDPGQTTLEAVQAVEAAAEVIEALNKGPDLFEAELFVEEDPDSLTVPQQDTIRMKAVHVEAVERAVAAAKDGANRATAGSIAAMVDENAETLPPLEGPPTASFEDDVPTTSFEDQIVTLPPLASEPTTVPAALFDPEMVDDDEVVSAAAGVAVAAASRRRRDHAAAGLEGRPRRRRRRGHIAASAVARRTRSSAALPRDHSAAGRGQRAATKR